MRAGGRAGPGAQRRGSRQHYQARWRTGVCRTRGGGAYDGVQEEDQVRARRPARGWRRATLGSRSRGRADRGGATGAGLDGGGASMRAADAAAAAMALLCSLSLSESLPLSATSAPRVQNRCHVSAKPLKMSTGAKVARYYNLGCLLCLVL